MSEFQFICKVSEIPEGEGRSFAVEDKVVGIFNQDGKFFAIDDGCPHMAASLSTGHLEDFVITCPLHAWRFDIRDGSWCDNPRVKINSYELRVIDNQIEIRLEPQSD